MSANEKPSEIAARTLRENGYLKSCDPASALSELQEDRCVARSINATTRCDSLAEENQRLRGVLERIANWPEVWIESGVQMRDLAVEALKK